MLQCYVILHLPVTVSNAPHRQSCSGCWIRRKAVFDPHVVDPTKSPPSTHPPCKYTIMHNDLLVSEQFVLDETHSHWGEQQVALFWQPTRKT
ncbi:hypothetical protein JAAARDRAFT_300096 [Jaapia argillacea MUCL 33604]|uniref:Uncharacterized protein n=1 Tax=Jaapia argillacea MUCL 33604 TaxID=933084 RepID=A0A067PZP9_9AGAM|nr:hypothetical protein JAAARDRAFT_300096 [Jaapia argillacea MUCL 33604]